MKKKRFFLLLAAALLLLILCLLLHGRQIGTIKGPEMDQIVIDGVTYVQNNSTGLSYKDKGRFLGRAVSGDTTFRLYTVKGDISVIGHILRHGF